PETQVLAVSRVPFSIGAADLDGNGWIDLVSASDNIGTSILYNQVGVFGNRTDLKGGGATIIAADFNMDGRKDLFVGPSHPLLFLQQTNGSFVKYGYDHIDYGGYGTIVADFNRDGRPDIFL